MKTFLKTLIGGALGIGALYVVGKICYEAGKDVAEVERQLGQSTADTAGMGTNEDSGCSDNEVPEKEKCEAAETATSNEYWDRQKDELHKVFDDARKQMAENEKKQSAASKMLDKVRNAKMFIRVKKAFEKKGDRSPGILGSLLSNPDGAKIEAFVKNGGVQINVTPRVA